MNVAARLRSSFVAGTLLVTPLAVTVFVPHSPNPTAGSLVMAADGEVYDLDMSVRRGLRLVVTTGLGVENPEELPTGVVR